MSQKKHIDAIKSATQHQQIPGIEQDNVKSESSPSQSSTASPTHSNATGKPKMALQHPPPEQPKNIPKQQPSYVYSKPLSQITPQHHLPIPLSLQPNRSGSIERNTNILHPSNDQQITLHPTQQNDLNQELNVPEVVEHELQSHVSIEPKHKQDQIKLHSSTFNTTMVVPQGLVNIHATNTNPIKPGGGLDLRALQPVKSIPQQQKQQGTNNDNNNNNGGKKFIVKKPSTKKSNHLKDVVGVIQNPQHPQQQSNTSPQQNENNDNDDEPTMDLSDFVQDSPLPPRKLNQSTYESISTTYNKDNENQYQQPQQQQQRPSAAISNSTNSQHSNLDDVIIPSDFQQHLSFQHDDEKNSEIEMGKFVQHKQHKDDDIDHHGLFSITPMPADDKVPIHNESQSNAQIIHPQPSSHQIVTNNNDDNNNDQIPKPIDNNQIPPSLARRKSISKLDQRGGPLIRPSTSSTEQNNIDQPTSKPTKPSKHEVDIGEVFDHQYKLESVQSKQNDSTPIQHERFLIEPREQHNNQLDDEKDSKSHQLNQNVKSPRKYTKKLPMQQTGDINLHTIPNSTSPSVHNNMTNNNNNNNLSILPSLPEPISTSTPIKYHSPHQLSSSNNSIQSSNRSDFVVLDTYDKDQSKSGTSSSKLSGITNESEISNYPLSNQHINSHQNNYPMNIASTPTTSSISLLDCHLPTSTQPQKLSPQNSSTSLYDCSIDNSAIDTGSVQTAPYCHNYCINQHQAQNTGQMTQSTIPSHNNNNNNNFRLPPSNNNYIPNNTTTNTTTINHNNNNNTSISIHKKRRHSNDDGQPNIPPSNDTWSIPTTNNDPFSKPTTSTCSIQGSTIDKIEDIDTPNVDQQLCCQNHDQIIQPTNSNELNQTESTSSTTSSSSNEHSHTSPIEDNTEDMQQISLSFDENQFSPNQSHDKMINRQVISTDQQYDDNRDDHHTTFITNNVPSRTTSILSIDTPISPHPTPLVDEQASTNQAQCGSLGNISEYGYDTSLPSFSTNQQQIEEQQYNPNNAYARSKSCNPLQQQQFYDQQQQSHDQKQHQQYHPHHHPSASSTSLNIDNYNQITLPNDQPDQVTPIPLFHNESTSSHPNSQSSQPLSRPLSSRITPPAPIPQDSIQKFEDHDGIDSTLSQLPQKQLLLESNFPHNHQPNNQSYNHPTRYVDNIIMKDDKMNQPQQSSQQPQQPQQSSQQLPNSVRNLQLQTDSRNLSKSKHHHQVEFTANNHLFTTHSKSTAQPKQDHKPQSQQHHISTFSPSTQGYLADIDESYSSSEQVEIQKDAINKTANNDNNNHHNPIGRNNAINPTRNPLSDTNMTDVEHIYKQQQQDQQNKMNENHHNVNMNNNVSTNQSSNNQQHSTMIDFQCNSQVDLRHHDHELQHEIFPTKQYVVFPCKTPMGVDDDGDIEDNTSTLTSPIKTNQSTFQSQPQSTFQSQHNQPQSTFQSQHNQPQKLPQLTNSQSYQSIEEDEHKSSKLEQHHSIPQQRVIAKDKQNHCINSDNNIHKHENNIDSQ